MENDFFGKSLLALENFIHTLGESYTIVSTCCQSQQITSKRNFHLFWTNTKQRCAQCAILKNQW